MTAAFGDRQAAIEAALAEPWEPGEVREISVCQGPPICDSQGRANCPWCELIVVDEETRNQHVTKPGEA
jgi:hypothetical protein